MPRLLQLADAAGKNVLAFSAREADIEVQALTSDSRQVVPGTLFFALRGVKSDGSAFIQDAVQRGAAAVVTETPDNISIAVPVVSTSNARLALALCASAMHAPQPACMVAVTGTDGKTSTADFYRQLAQNVGKPAASIGTLGVKGSKDDAAFPVLHTTPDPVALHRTLAALARQGIEHVAMEASSHGLDQYRLDGVKLRAAAFTNLTRDHLDYHATVEEYFAAKRRLFAELLPPSATAVLNADDARFTQLQAICTARRHKILSFGKQGKDMRLKDIIPTLHGQIIKAELFGESYALEVNLVGGFQAMNILAAFGLAVASGLDTAQLVQGISALKGVSGRLEQVATHAAGAPIFVDYAHTPAALANILRTLRPHVEHKLAVVFGCGGDRDPGKRPEMGKAAQELADRIFVTDDNPRSENPAAIRKAIMEACPNAREIGDRADAIHEAVASLQAGDVLVIAGKGHEKTQTIGGSALPFDDAAVARAAVGVKPANGNHKKAG